MRKADAQMKLLVGFIMMVFTAAILLPVHTAMAARLTMPLLGDVTEDGSLDLLDCAFLSQYLARIASVKLTTQGLANADVNSDGKVNLIDLIILRQHVTYSVKFNRSTSATGDFFSRATNTPDAGEEYLNAVTAAGEAYDFAASYARQMFESFTADIPTGSDAYNLYLNAYREAIYAARAIYDDAIYAAQTNYTLATSAP